MIRVAIVTVIDTARFDFSEDKCTPYIKSTLHATPGFECRQHFKVPDERERIMDIVLKIRSQKVVDWLITTGGAGFGLRDVTPEAISPLLTRNAPGLVHLLLSASLARNPLAALSRPVAGMIDDMLVVSLPGDLEAVKDGLEVLLRDGLVRYAVELMKGGSGDRVRSALGASGSSATGDAVSQRSVSQRSASQKSEPQSHVQTQSQPRSTPKLPTTSLAPPDSPFPVSARHRTLSYPMHLPAEAIHLVLKHTKPLPTEIRLIGPELAGHVLAEDVHALNDVPHTYTSAVDGYALRYTDPPTNYPVLTSLTHPPNLSLPLRTVYVVNVGQPLPPDTDAVILVDNTRLITASADGVETGVQTLVRVRKGENVRPPGIDVLKGERVMRKGDVVGNGGGEVGSLVFVGRKDIEVYRKPAIAIFSMGNDISDLHSAPASETGENILWDTNRPSLRALLQGKGFKVVDLGIVPNNISAHVSAVTTALQSADILLTTDSTTMSSAFLNLLIERQFQGTVHFGRVNTKPGKPTSFATIPVPFSGKGKERATEDGHRHVPVFSLPGNPASALVMFWILVLPALRRLGGWAVENCQLPQVKVELHHNMHLETRTEFHRARIRAGPHGLVAHSTGGQHTSRVTSLSGANGLVVLPPKTEGGKSELRKGEWAEAVLFDDVLG